MASVITINPIGPVQINQTFTVTGTLVVDPRLESKTDSDTMTAFPPTATDPPTDPQTWSFTHPAFTTAGTHTVTVKDGVSRASASISVTVNAIAESANGARLTDTAGSITLASGTQITLVQGSGLQIAFNGTVDASTANLALALYWNHTLFQKNTSGVIKSNGGGSGNWATQPVSASNTVVNDAAGFIISSLNQLVGLTGTGGAGTQLVFDGVTDTSTANAKLALWFTGTLYYENTSNTWFSGSSGNWTQIAGDPRTIATPKGIYTQGGMIFTPNNVPLLVRGAGFLEGSTPVAKFEGFTGNMSWQNNIDQMQALGFNTARLNAYAKGILTPSGWTLDPSTFNNGFNADLSGKNVLQFYEMIADYCSTKGMYVIISIKSTVGGIGSGFTSTGTFTGYSAANPSTFNNDGVTDVDLVNACAALGTAFGGKASFLGVELLSQPFPGAGRASWTGNNGQSLSLKDLYVRAGNALHSAVLAAAPGSALPLAICAGTQDGDLTAVETNPVVLTNANKVAYSLIVYPSPWPNGTGTVGGGDNGTTAQAGWTTSWGYLPGKHIAPVIVTEFGGSNATFFPNLSAYWTTVVPYFQGNTSGSSFYIGPGSGSFFDDAGNVFSMRSDGFVMMNGAPVNGGGGTSAMAYSDGIVYAQDSASLLWYTISDTGAIVAAQSPPPAQNSGNGAPDEPIGWCITNWALSSSGDVGGILATLSPTSATLDPVVQSGLTGLLQGIPGGGGSSSGGGGTGGGGTGNFSGATFVDDFTSGLSADNVFANPPTVGTWMICNPDIPQGTPENGAFMVNPNNPNTPDWDCYQTVNGNLELMMKLTPASELAYCQNLQFMGSQLISHFSQVRGYFEFKAQFATNVHGLNEAVWLYPIQPAPYYQELDNVEFVTAATSTVAAQTVHNADSAGTNLPSYHYAPGFDGSQWHTYGIMWDDTNITIYLDRVQQLQTPTPAGYQTPMALWISMQNGAADWSGPITDPSLLPVVMRVDYAAVWTKLPFN